MAPLKDYGVYNEQVDGEAIKLGEAHGDYMVVRTGAGGGGIVTGYKYMASISNTHVKIHTENGELNGGWDIKCFRILKDLNSKSPYKITTTINF